MESSKYLRISPFTAIALPILLVIASVFVTLMLHKPSAAGQPIQSERMSSTAEKPVTEIYYSKCGHTKPVEGTVSGLTAPDGIMTIDGYCPNHYLIKSTAEGKVSIFRLSESLEMPVMTLDINISWLPEADRTALNEGIRVDSERDLLSLIEDYTS